MNMTDMAECQKCGRDFAHVHRADHPRRCSCGGRLECGGDGLGCGEKAAPTDTPRDRGPRLMRADDKET